MSQVWFALSMGGAFGQQGIELCQALLREAGHEAVCVALNGDAVLPVSAPRATLYLINQPSVSLARALASSGMRGVIFTDDVVGILEHMLAADARWTARTAMHMLSTNLAAFLWMKTSHTLVISHEHQAGIGGAAQAVARHLGLPAPRAPHMPRTATSASSNRLSPTMAKAARCALQPLLHCLTDGVMRDVGWELPVFYHGPDLTIAPPPVVDLTGGARILYYGPFFHVPAGRWEVTLDLDLHPHLFDTPLNIVMLAELETECEAPFSVAEGGRYTVSFIWSHRKIGDNVQLRVQSSEGAIDGTLGFTGASLKYLGPLI